MKGEHMLMYALVFVLGFMISRMMGGRLIEGNYDPRDCSGVAYQDHCDSWQNKGKKKGDLCEFDEQCDGEPGLKCLDRTKEITELYFPNQPCHEVPNTSGWPGPPTISCLDLDAKGDVVGRCTPV